MTRRVVAILFLLVISLAAFGAEHNPPAADAAAHGSEKQTHGGGHTEEPKFLGLPFWIWKLANMLLFFGVLFYLIGGPMKRSFAARSQQIRDTAAEARERRAKADQMAADIQARLSRLEGEVQAIHERAQTEGERQKREMIAAAEAEAQKILANAQSEVDNRLRHARSELTEYAGQLAAERAEQLLKDKMTDEDRKKLFRESLAEVEGVRS